MAFYDDEYDQWLTDDLGDGPTVPGWPEAIPSAPEVTAGVSGPPMPAPSASGEGAYGLTFWRNRGFTPEQMFDANGQLRPGWRHIAEGYMYDGGANGSLPPTQTGTPSGRRPRQEVEREGRDRDAQNGLIGGYYDDLTGLWVSGSPRGSGGGGGGGGMWGGGGYGAAPSFSGWPSYQAPGFADPGVFDPGPAFTYREFVAPTAQTMINEPGFQFRLDQGRKALESSAAGKGILRSGGTLKDILGYGQNFASQEYGNVYNRALQEYDTNRQNAADVWGRQYGQRRDVYGAGADRANALNTFNVGNAQYGFNQKQRQAELDFGDIFNRWQQEGNWLKDLSVAGMD